MVLDMTMGSCHNLRDLQIFVKHLLALNIKILGIIILVLILHNHHCHITLIIHPLPNHLCLLEYNSIHPIILMDTYRIEDYDDDFVSHCNSMWK